MFGISAVSFPPQLTSPPPRLPHTRRKRPRCASRGRKVLVIAIHSPPLGGCVATMGEQVFCHFDRREKSNAQHCPEQREGSVDQHQILRFAQDDSPRRVRFLGFRLEMTLRHSLWWEGTKGRGKQTGIGKEALRLCARPVVSGGRGSHSLAIFPFLANSANTWKYLSPPTMKTSLCPASLTG